MVYSEGIPRKTASASKLSQVLCRALVKHNSLKPCQTFIKRRTFLRIVEQIN